MRFSKRGQSAIELIVLIGAVFFFIVSLLLIIQNNLNEKYSEKRGYEIKIIALQIKEEIDLAHSSIDGYRREFRIPEEVSGMKYNAQITEGIIYLITNDEKNSIAIPTKEITGQIKIGLNKIKKEGGIVYLNE